MRIIPVMLLIVIVLMTTACSIDYKVQVRSNTSWSGSFGNRSVDGTGDQLVDLPDDPPECIVVQKDTETGILSIEIQEEGGWLLNPTNNYNIVSTTASYGLVSDCTED